MVRRARFGNLLDIQLRKRIIFLFSYRVYEGFQRMISPKKYIILGSIVILVVTSGLTLWLVTRVSIPEDVTSKLGEDLINRIQSGTLTTKHDCIVACTNSEDMYNITDLLPNESVVEVWESFGMFHAFLFPEQIFSLARMNEVTRIDYNSYEIVC